MRILLALAAFALCVFEGVRKSLSMKKRADFLGEILTMLSNFSSEIQLRAPTFEQLVESEKCAFTREAAERETGLVEQNKDDAFCETALGEEL